MKAIKVFDYFTTLSKVDSFCFVETIRLAAIADLKFYWEHLRRHGSESGRDGDVIFSPNEVPWDRVFDEFLKEK